MTKIKHISVNQIFSNLKRRIIFVVSIILIIAICLTIFLKISSTYSNVQSSLNFIKIILRSEIINGQLNSVYSNCKKIYVNGSFEKLIIKRNNKTICDFGKQSNLGVTFSESLYFGDDSSTEILANITISKNISNIIYEALAYVLLTIFIYIIIIKNFSLAYVRIQTSLIDPINTLSGHIAKGNNNHINFENNSFLSEVNLLFETFNNYFDSLEKNRNLEFQLIQSSVFSNLASQVSHDIRSPLAALNMTIANLKDIPEQQRITLRAASNRINDIANTLLTRAKEQKTDSGNSGSSIHTNVNTPMKLQVELLPAILDTIVSEKRVQFRDKMQVEIEADFKNAYGAFANVNPTELSRVISNLINNSVEALPNGQGRFTLSVTTEKNQVVIVAQDNGKGIPAHILEKLGQMGVTHGKEGTQSGSGLGVYHAKSTIEQFGGQFEIQSAENVGTKIIITLPLAPGPKWFVEKMKIAPQSQIISLDDDLSIHNVWKGRFQSLGFNQNEITHLTFTSGIDFKDWVNNQPISQSKNIQQRIYLIDYELLNQKQTGLDIVEELGIGSQSILVTSRYEEINIRERCEKLGVQLIPKGMAGLVPIDLKQPLKRLDAILIDDDPLMGYVWTETAKTSNKLFEWFNDPELFFAKAEQYEPSVEIYIDVSLAKNVKGQDVAIKLSQMGFANLHLATGYEADSVAKPSVVKSVIGKDCPL